MMGANAKRRSGTAAPPGGIPTGRALAGLAAAGLAWATAAGATAGEAHGLAARMAVEASASEHWDLTARFTSGHALFVRAMLTNAGPGSNTAVVTGHVAFPDGSAHAFHNGRREGRWSTSEDRLALKVGGSELDLRGPEQRFAKQSRKQGIQLEVRFAARPLRVDGSPGDPGVAALPVSPIRGSFQVGDMTEPLSVEGVATLRHAWTRAPEARVTRRWIDVLAGDARNGAVLWGHETPDGQRRQWLSLYRDGRVQLERSDVRLEPAGSTGPEAAYPTPERIALRGPGVEGAVVLGPERVRADPMRIVPQPFRWFLSREIAPRRILAEGRLRLQVAGEAEPFEAPALVGVTWTHPVSRKGAL